MSSGDKWVDGQNLEAVARFVGLEGTGHVPLPPEVLHRRLLVILDIARSCVRQIPPQRLLQNATHNRKRDLRLLSHHLFRIAEAFLEVAIDGVTYTRGMAAEQLGDDGTFTTGTEIAAYGDSVIARLERWWETLEDRTCQREVDTFYGRISLHRMLERTTWHPAQHTRQLIDVLEGFGIALDKRLTPEILAGLPMPERLWE